MFAKNNLVILLCYFASQTEIILSNDEIKTKDGILILDKNNLERAISENEYIFVKFYASWSEKNEENREMEPEYVTIADKVKKLNLAIKFAKIDASKERELCKKYRVSSFPTLTLFRRKTALEYKGKKTSKEIISWLQNQARPAAQQLDTMQQATKTILAEDIVVIGFFKDVSDFQFQKFIKIADSFQHPTFAFSFNREIQTKFGNETFPIVLFKDFDYGKAVFEEEITLENMQNFVKLESSLLITELNQVTADKVFQGEVQTFLLLFVSQANPETSSLLKSILPYAHDYKTKIVFLSINTDDEHNMDILKYFKLNSEDVPTAVITTNKNDSSKFKMNAVLTPENLKKFLHDFRGKRLKKFLLSEELSENWNKSHVNTLVGTNFDSVTNDINKNVLVLFHKDDCDKCEEWLDVFLKVGEHFKDRKDVTIAKINVDLNEFEKSPIRKIPSVLLYKKIDNGVVRYKGKASFENIVQLLNSSGGDAKDETNQNVHKEEL